MAEGPTCLAFSLAVDLANARDLPETWAPGALVQFGIGDKWRFTLNRSRDEQDAIPGFHIGVDRFGWPAGLINLRDGMLVVGIEGELIADLEAAIAAEMPEAPHA